MIPKRFPSKVVPLVIDAQTFASFISMVSIILDYLKKGEELPEKCKESLGMLIFCAGILHKWFDDINKEKEAFQIPIMVLVPSNLMTEKESQ